MIAAPDYSSLQVRSHTQRLETLQIVRGWAALLVVCRHITGSNLFYFNYDLLEGVFRPGWNSIDFFFALSGFLFGSIHLKDVGNKDKMNSFLIKRFIRIYPAYWVAAIVSLIFFLIQTSDKLSLIYVLKSFLLIPQESVPFLGVAWSLCFEIVFYLLFGLYIYGGKRVMIGGFVIHLGLILVLYQSPNLLHGSFILSFIGNPYYLEFIAGFMGGWICFTFSKEKLEKVRFPLLVIGLLTFSLVKIYSLSDFTYSNDFFLTRLGFAVSISFVIIALSQYSVNADKVYVKPFLILGNASFSLYLWHPIVLALFFKGFILIQRTNLIPSGPFTYLAFSIIVLLFSIMIAILIFDKLERPLLNYLKNRYFN